jgi:hypothetical protein
VPALVALTAANWVIYYGTTPAGQRYIGITSNFAARSAQHLARSGMRITQANFGRMDYFSAKALEQRLIELSGGPEVLANRINSIARTNTLYEAAQRWANNMLTTIKECADAIPGVDW